MKTSNDCYYHYQYQITSKRDISYAEKVESTLIKDCDKQFS